MLPSSDPNPRLRHHLRGLWVPEFVEIARPLYTSTKWGCTKPLNCTETKQKAFQTFKTVLSSTPGLVQMSQNLRRALTQLEIFYHTLSQLIRPCSYRMAHPSKHCRQMRTKTLTLVKTSHPQDPMPLKPSSEEHQKQNTERWLCNACVTQSPAKVDRPLCFALICFGPPEPHIRKALPSEIMSRRLPYVSQAQTSAVGRNL